MPSNEFETSVPNKAWQAPFIIQPGREITRDKQRRMPGFVLKSPSPADRTF